MVIAVLILVGIVIVLVFIMHKSRNVYQFKCCITYILAGKEEILMMCWKVEQDNLRYDLVGISLISVCLEMRKIFLIFMMQVVQVEISINDGFTVCV